MKTVMYGRTAVVYGIDSVKNVIDYEKVLGVRYEKPDCANDASARGL